MLFLLLALAVAVGGMACEGRRLADPPAHTAARAAGHGRVAISTPARRVVSLLPSATDVLIAIGAGDRLVGRTSYDADPSLRALPVVGGATDPSIEAILALAPDLVVSWETVVGRGLERQLAAAGVPVVSLRGVDTTDLFHAIAQLGKLVGRDSAADALASQLHSKLEIVRRSVAHRRRPTVLYVAWNNPLITAGPHTFVGQLITLAGGTMIFPEVADNWPTVAVEEVVRRQPEVLVFPAGEMPGTTADTLARLPGWRNLDAVRQRRVVHLPVAWVDRSGPHVAAAARALRDAFHPDIAGTGTAR